MIKLILRAALLEAGELEKLEAALQASIENKEELYIDSETNE